MKENNGRTFEYSMNVVKSGFKRFYDEGYLKWSIKNVNAEIHGAFKDNLINVTDQPIQEKFKEWEKAGFIKIIGNDDKYLEVINPNFDK